MTTDITDLLGPDLPGTEHQLEICRIWTENLQKHRGQAWVRDHKGLLWDQWIWIVEGVFV